MKVNSHEKFLRRKAPETQWLFTLLLAKIGVCPNPEVQVLYNMFESPLGIILDLLISA